MSLPAYAEYQESGFTWLGKVPLQWSIQPFYSVASERNESNKGMVEDNLLSLSYGRIVRKNIDSNDGLLPESFETYQIVRAGDIIFRLTDLQNDKRSLRTAIVQEDGIITSAYVSAIPRSIESRYLSYLLRSYDMTKVFYSMGGGLRQSMKFSDIRRLPTLVPPSNEQIAISAFLDVETAKIDALIFEQEKLMTLLAEKRQATISHAVTKGLNANVPMKHSGLEWLGTVPDGWELKRLKDCGGEIVDCKNRTPDEYPEENYLVVRTTCVKNGKFSVDGGYFTNESSFIEWTRKGRPQHGDILFTREAPTGEACLAPKDLNFCLGQRMMYIRPDTTKLLSEFLLYSIYGPLVRARIESKARGSTVGHLRVGEVGELPLLIPPCIEQKAIVEYLNRELGAIDALHFEANRGINLLKERRSALISAAVTGKIDVRQPIPHEKIIIQEAA